MAKSVHHSQITTFLSRSQEKVFKTNMLKTMPSSNDLFKIIYALNDQKQLLNLKNYLTLIWIGLMKRKYGEVSTIELLKFLKAII